jgi:hypothetical protein
MHVLKPDALESAQELDRTPLVTAVTTLDPVDRWAVYRRLQDLGLSCRYGRERPMTVSIHSPTEVLLVWSVVQTVTASRVQTIDHLEHCWQQRSPR